MTNWYEDLNEYERNLEEMATANSDQAFQDEMKHVNQWFFYLTDPEKTATLYTLIQGLSSIQLRFFNHVIQQMRQSQTKQANNRAFNLINLNRRVPATASLLSPGQTDHSPIRPSAVGDSKPLFDPDLTADWLGTKKQEIHPYQQQYKEALNVHRASNVLRPRSVLNLNPTLDPFLPSLWSNQPTMKDKAIERPKSVDISSWTTFVHSDTNHTDTLNSSTQSSTPIQHTRQHCVSDFYSDTLTGTFSSVTTNGVDSVDFTQRRNSSYLSQKMDFSSEENVILEQDRRYSSLTSNSINMSPIEPLDIYMSIDSPIARQPEVVLHSGNEEDITDVNLDNGCADKDKSRMYQGNGVVDFELMEDVPAWLRSVRLHKYTSNFQSMLWQDMVKLDNDALIMMGVAALGARRKMLKIFANIKQFCIEQEIPY
ncbi:hypothetical protein BDB01DRAFT_835060 [Pilobolus umbonatus]|nr:hypothetical protein BDB01DRAFT_835060 [Pilobolus umbonatus]